MPKTPHNPEHYEALQRPLDVFRAQTRRLAIHPREKAVLWVVCLHLVFLPWAIGGMRLWVQWISLGLGVLGLVMALLPRDYTEEHTGGPRFRLLPYPKLLLFPIFWLGLALLGLVTLQALNPAWVYRTDGRGWWMQATAHKEWLPAGVDVPFERWGPWRMLIIYSSVWLTMCTIWIGFTRRRTVQLFFLVLAFNGLALVTFGLAQRFFGNGKMFWVWNSPSYTFFASFVYKNHGGAYLLLALAITTGLAAWYYLRGIRRLEKSNPAGVLAFLTTFVAVGILTSQARGATLVMLVFLTVCVIGFVVHQFSLPSENRKPVIGIALVLLFGFFLKNGLDAVQSRVAWDRLAAGVTGQDQSLQTRGMATRASLEMLNEHWQKGVGAGGFAFLFPVYQHRHPELMNPPQFWQHAHNDVVQIPIEHGIAGIVLIVTALGYFTVKLVRNFFWQNPLSASLVLGLVLLVGYAWFDFPFQNPAILVTWWSLWAAVVMWTGFEEQHLKG